MTPDALNDFLDLLDRAVYNLANGWHEAAIDALGRASRLITEQTAHNVCHVPSPTETHMQPDQRPQKPPREPVHEKWPDVKTENPGFPRTPDPYPLPGKPQNENPRA